MFSVYNILEANVSSYHPSTHCGNRILDSEDTLACTSPVGCSRLWSLVGCSSPWNILINFYFQNLCNLSSCEKTNYLMK